MPDYLFFAMVAIVVVTSLYTRRLMKKRSANVGETLEGTSEIVRGLAKLNNSDPDYSGAVAVIRDQAKAALSGYLPLDRNSIALHSIVADCNGALNKGKVSREKFTELQGAFLRVSMQKK